MWFVNFYIETKQKGKGKYDLDLLKTDCSDDEARIILGDSIYSDYEFILSNIVYCRRDNIIRYFVVKINEDVINVHIEPIDKNMRMKYLKETIPIVEKDIYLKLKSIDRSIISVSGEISILGNREQEFYKNSVKKKVKIVLKNNLETKMYVPVATIVASTVLKFNIEQSLFNAGTAILAMIIWLPVEYLKVKSYIFEEA